MADTARDFVDLLNQREIDRALGLFVPEARVDPGPWADRVLTDRAAIKNFLGTFLPALPGLKITVTGVFRCRNEAVVTVDVHATMSQLNPDPAHVPEWKGGRKVMWSGAFLIAFNPDQRMISLRIFGDATEVRWVAPVAPPA